MSKIPASEITCKNCENKFTGKYCNLCGEKVLTDHDRTIFHFFEEAFHFLTHFEGKFLTTIKTILTKPGQLSLDYSAGLRKPYFKPLSFFMLLVILYLIFPMLSGLNMELKYYPNMVIFGDKFQSVIDAKLASKGMDMESFSEMFHHKAEKVSKLLLIIYIPFTAIILKALFSRRKRFFSDFLIIATEFCSFYILFTYFILPLLIGLISFVSFGQLEPRGESILFYFNVATTLIFALISLRKFFDQKWWIILLKSIVFLPFFFLFIFVVYKYILFLLTMLYIG